MKPVANLVHVPDVEAALAWYKLAFENAIERVFDDLVVLDVNGFAIELVNADEKVSAGKSGSVTYWSVDDLEAEIARFSELGSIVYRGPMKIEDGMGMCQVTDPFGNLIGLRGPYSNHCLETVPLSKT
jgi:predicted enzyme related to lactoylglutathione lyase